MECSVCRGVGGTRESCAPTNGSTADEIKRGLGQTAREIFDKGPSDGYIYMYGFKRNRNGSSGRYKIGHTYRTPEERVRQQERNNDEEYFIILEIMTPHARFTENVISEHLKAIRGCHQPRDDVEDGGTEWYTGERDVFMKVILSIVELVKYKYGSCAPN